MQHGARLLPGGKEVCFSLWAPEAQSVALVLENRPPLPLPAVGGGWYCRQLPCPAGTRYHYLIDNQLSVPDPASRAQAGDVHGPSLVVDPDYPWQQTDWRGRPWHETVLYELHAGTLGGYQGIEKRLDELCALGVTAIELMPVNAFPGSRNWGYDGVLPYAPARSYGSPAQLRQLVDAAHARGLMVFMDVVYNHFGPEGNYLPRYARRFFREDLQTPWGQTIDFRQAEVRAFFISNALMWLQEYRMDGLRLDAVQAIPDNVPFLKELSGAVRAALPDRHIHLVLENRHNQASLLHEAYQAQWNDDGHHILHVLLTGENQGYYADYSLAPGRQLLRFLDEGFIHQGQQAGLPGEPTTGLPPTAFVLYLQNHDQTGNRAMGERLTQLARPDALRAATVLLLLSPMIPLLFMGEEWGSQQPFLFFTDHPEALARTVRAGRCRELAGFSGFSAARMPDPNAPDTFKSSRPDFSHQHDARHQPWLALYRQLLAIRHQEIIPRLAGACFSHSRALGEGAVSARWRLGDGSPLRLDLNLGQETVNTGPASPGRLLFSSRHPHSPHDGSLPPGTAIAYLESPHGG